MSVTPNGRGDSRHGYPFTHPIASADSSEEPRLAAMLMRRVLVILHAMGALQLLAVLALPDPDTGDHTWLLAVSLGSATVAVGCALVREPPDWLLVSAPFAGTMLVTTVVATAHPMSGTPFFYVWTTLTSAYFLQRREAAIHVALVAVAFGVALAVWAEPQARVMMFLDTMVPAVT